MKINVKKINEKAVIPQYAHNDDACFDLIACDDVIISPGETKKIPTGLIFEIPVGYKMVIYPRSGISLNTPLRIANSPGIVDSGYRGEVCILMTNTQQKEIDYVPLLYLVDNTIKNFEYYCLQYTYVIRCGDKIAQAEIVPIYKAEFCEVNELSSTVRGGNGFGSTGIKV